MKLISFLCLMGIFASLLSCKTREYQYPPQDYTDQQILFGSGGGFTGFYTHYALLENGQLFVKEPKAEAFTEMKKISKKETKAFFKTIAQMMEEGVKQKATGNMNYYVKLTDGEGEYELRWADDPSGINQEILDLYQALMVHTQPPTE